LFLVSDALEDGEARWAAEHAAACPACAALAAAYRRCEEQWKLKDAPPAGFADAMVRVWRAERFARENSALRVMTPSALATGLGCLLATTLAVLVGVLMWRDPAFVSDTASWLVEYMTGELILPASDFHVLIGGFAGVGVALGAVAYYYLTPRVR